METTLFGHTIKLKSYYCELNGYQKCPVEKPYINLYVQFNGCNATCKFCEFKEIAHKFDILKFYSILEELKDSIEVRKISFTGGEPTLNMGTLSSGLLAAKTVIPDAFRVVNTNGKNLKLIYDIGADSLINSISLSRHHYNDKENNEILGFDAPTANVIKELQSLHDDKMKLHLSCNLIKGYIDSPEEIYKYLEVASRLGIRDTGFVSLMKINDYAKEHFIDFQKMKFILENTPLHKIKEWKFEDKCKCNNYLYIPTDTSGDVVQVYSRCVLKPSYATNTLVFNGLNLSEGFNGNIIK